MSRSTIVLLWPEADRNATRLALSPLVAFAGTLQHIGQPADNVELGLHP